MSAQIHWHDIQELACAVCGLDYEDVVNNNREDEIYDALEDKLGVDFDGFTSVVFALLPMVTVATSGLSGSSYRGFGKDGVWLVKEEISYD